MYLVRIISKAASKSDTLFSDSEQPARRAGDLTIAAQWSARPPATGEASIDRRVANPEPLC
jgi:hypothetical protein